MQKSKIFLAILLIFVISSFATLTGAEKLYLGSKTPYPYEKTEFTPAPAGYEPVFIYVAGRHGSRNLSGFKYDKTWLELLAAAEKEGQLTEKGKSLKADIQKIADFEKGKYALLTEMGKRELREIGERCGQNFKKLFATGKPIFADATVVDRAQESRDGFLEGLKSTGYKGEITSIFYKQNRDPYLRPYDIAQKYIAYDEKGKWNKDVDAFANSDKMKAVAVRLVSQFFTPAFLERIDKGEFKLVDLKKKTIIKSIATASDALYELYIINPSLKEEGLTVDMKKYFILEDLALMEKVQTASEYYSQGPGGPDANGISTNIMAPLVKRMINEVDSAIAKKTPYIGVFSFAHAETQIPLVCFLDIANSNISYKTVEEAVNNWSTADFGPMAGNVQWIVYSNGKDTLVKMLLLEKEVAFAKAIKPVSGPYYKWEDVKEYYSKKVEATGIKMDSTIFDNIDSLYKNF